MLKCIDCFQSEVRIRSRAIKDIAAMFEAVQVKGLISASEEEPKVSVLKLTTFYDVVCQIEHLIEILRLRSHKKAAEIDVNEAKD